MINNEWTQLEQTRSQHTESLKGSPWRRQRVGQLVTRTESASFVKRFVELDAISHHFIEKSGTPLCFNANLFKIFSVLCP